MTSSPPHPLPAAHSAPPIPAPELPQQTPDATVRSLRAATLAALLALIVLCLAWELWLAPTGRGTLAVKALPLLLCVAGLWRHRMYTFRWLSLLVWLYFMEGVVRATTEKGIGQAVAAAEVVLSLALFVFSGIYIRWRLRHAARAQAATASPTQTPVHSPAVAAAGSARNP